MQKISETDPGPLPTSKMEFAVTIMDPPYIPSLLCIAQDTPEYIIYYSHYCCPVKSPALAIFFLSLLNFFASKPGKICTQNSVDSFSYLFVLLYL